MRECRKRQVERRGGETIHRCINKKADAYRQPVDASICDSCPVRVMLKQAGEGQKGKKKVALPVVDTSDYPTCEFRFKHPHEPKPMCGVTGLETNLEICRRCTKDEKMATPNLLEKVVSYSAAVRKWVAAGRPERTQEEIESIFNEHCNRCEMFDKVKKICNSCGCPSNTDQPAIRNKLKMATEACPLGRFPAKVSTCQNG